MRRTYFIERDSYLNFRAWHRIRTWGQALLLGLILTGSGSETDAAEEDSGLLDAANLPPSITKIADQETQEDLATPELAFTVSDAETEPALLKLQADSSNPELVPPTHMIFSGTGASRRLVVVPAPNQSGSAIIQVIVSDGAGASSRTSFLLTVTAVNDPPKISEIMDVTSVNGEWKTFWFVVLDPETEPHNLTMTAESSNPDLVSRSDIVFDGSKVFRNASIRPAALRSGEATITLTVTDEGGATAQSRFQFTHVVTEHAPVVQSLALTTTEDTPIPIILQATDGDGDSVGYVLLSEPELGTLSGTAPNLIYTPRENIHGSDRFTFRANDGKYDSPSGEVTISIQPVNDPPEISPIQDQTIIQGEAGALIEFTVHDLETPTEHLGLQVTVPSSTLVTRERIVLEQTGDRRRLQIAPFPGQTGEVVITIVATDGDAARVEETFKLTVLAAKDPPAAVGQSVSTMEDVPVEITLAGVDPKGRKLTFRLLNRPEKGELSGTPPNLIFTPHRNVFGQDRFTFTVTNGVLESEPATVNIAIVPRNDPPAANSQFVVLTEDTNRAITLAGTDLENDTLTYVVASLPAKGSLSGTPPNLTYTPNPNATGPDHFAFQVTDGAAMSPSATVSLQITPLNDPPLAKSQFVVLAEDSATAVTLTGSDADNDPLSFLIVTSPEQGTLSGTPPNLVYKGNLNATGADRFTFVVNDGVADSAPVAVNILIASVNDSPVAQNQFVTLAQGGRQEIVLTGRDVEGDTLTYEVVTLPVRGVLSGLAPYLTYIPNPGELGPDSFTFRVHDGALESSSAAVNLTILTAVDPPTISDISDQEVQEDMPTAHIAFSVSDPTSPATELLVQAHSSNEDLVPSTGINFVGSGETRTIQVIPAPGRFGTASITVTVRDPKGLSDSTTFTVTVLEVQKPPVALAQEVWTAEDKPIAIQLKGTDRRNRPLQFVIVDRPVRGSLEGTPPEVTYVPSADWHGTDRFSFTVHYGEEKSSRSAVTVRIAPVNDPPRISPIPNAVVDAQMLLRPISLEVTDPDTPANQLVFSSVSSNAALVPEPDVLFDAESGEHRLMIQTGAGSGESNIRVTVSDGELSASTEFVVTVVNPEPPRVSIVNPLAWTIHEPGSDLLIEAEIANDPGNVAHVEFMAGSAVLGKDSSPPYSWNWPAIDRGSYLLTAKAVTQEGTAVLSDPVELLFDHVEAEVAFFHEAVDPEIEILKEYLFQQGISCETFQLDQIVETDLERFDVIVWSKANVPELKASHVRAIRQWADSGKAFYFVGDSLPLATASHESGETAVWRELIHLKEAAMDNSWPEAVAVDSEMFHPLTVGPAGSVEGFTYPVTAQHATEAIGILGEIVLGKSGYFDLLVAFEHPVTQRRSVTQRFAVTAGGDPESIEQRRRLFQNAVWWLLGRTYTFRDLTVSIEASANRAIVGEPVSLALTVSHSGEFPASGVRLVTQLPPELQFLSAKTVEGSVIESGGVIRFDLRHFSSAQQKTVTIEAMAVAPGTITTAATVEMDGPEVSEDNNSTDPPAVIVVEGNPLPRRLQIGRGANGPLRIQFTPAIVGNYVIESSSDLIRWQRFKAISKPAVGSTIEIPIVPSEEQRFFRQRLE